MSEIFFTAGPWIADTKHIIDRHGKRFYWYVRQAGRLPRPIIVSFERESPDVDGYGDPEIEANARLIAQSPKMYALCEAVANLWSDSAGPDRNELIAVMKQAQEIVEDVRGDSDQ